MTPSSDLICKQAVLGDFVAHRSSSNCNTSTQSRVRMRPYPNRSGLRSRTNFDFRLRGVRELHSWPRKMSQQTYISIIELHSTFKEGLAAWTCKKSLSSCRKDTDECFWFGSSLNWSGALDCPRDGPNFRLTTPAKTVCSSDSTDLSAEIYNSYEPELTWPLTIFDCLSLANCQWPQ